MEKATFGAGCFWCIEACFKDLKGVVSVEPGYAGGDPDRASYKEVCEGNTGHAEVAQITFDPSVITFEELLELFWFVHDPTQLNRQGNDVGSQYRSVIFYHSMDQRNSSIHYRDELDKKKVWEKLIVTEITEFTQFFPAEDYHHNYFENNPGNLYCQSVVRPKVEKFKEVFANKMK